MSIEKNRIQDKLLEADTYIGTIKKIEKLSIEDYLQDDLYQRSAERVFQVLAQIMLDVCTMIVANLDEQKPKDYSGCINILRKIKTISGAEFQEYRNIIKLRNIVTHQYTAIDQEIMYNAIKTIRRSFERYRESVIKYLRKEEKML